MPGAEFNFQGSVVAITGGAKGIGAAIAEAFLAAGATVAVCARSEPDKLPSASGRSAEFQVCDVREADAVSTWISSIAAKHGQLDILVNNAGGAPESSAADASPRFFDSIVALNLLGPMYCAQAANKIMQTQDGGGIVINIASVSGVRASPGTAMYGAAKAGLVNLTQSLAAEWGPKVRVNVVVTGLIATPNAEQHYGPRGMQNIAEKLPLKRMGQPKDIANACLFLASPASSYVSGAQLAVHGGGEPAFIFTMDKK
jgi:NAD(P)-dependent dehydrogenase (short-subunit alcohol dehydrogenase family)